MSRTGAFCSRLITVSLDNRRTGATGDLVIGYRTIKPADLQSVWKTGLLQKVVLVTTFTLTMLIPLQFAVLVAVGVSLILHVVRQSNQITIKRWQFGPDGDLIETDPPAESPAGEVVVLQPYGSLFFAAAPVFEAALPRITDNSRKSVVILRLRGRTDLGTTFMDVLYRYAKALATVGSKLVIVSASARVQEQLVVTGITATIGAENVYTGDERLGADPLVSRRSSLPLQEIGWSAHDAGHEVVGAYLRNEALEPESLPEASRKISELLPLARQIDTDLKKFPGSLR